MKHLRKMFTAFITATGGALITASQSPPDGSILGIAGTELVAALAIGFAAALSVYIIPNSPPNPPQPSEPQG